MMSAIDLIDNPRLGSTGRARAVQPLICVAGSSKTQSAPKSGRRKSGTCIDLSKNLINEETLNQLLELADQTECLSSS